MGTVTFTLTGTGNGPCTSSVTDTFTLNITPEATVDAGPDATICEATYQLSGSFTNGTNPKWTTSGTGDFPSGDTSLTAIYEPSADDFAQGFVDLTLTVDKFSPCEGTRSDIVRLTLNEKPLINIGTTTPSICECETYSFAGATVTNQTSVLWSTDCLLYTSPSPRD